MTVTTTVIFPEGVAELWKQERRKAEGADAPAVTVERVHDFARWSKPTPAGNKRKNRYEDHPMPYPRCARGGNQPAWDPAQEDDLRAFWHDRLDGAERDPAVVKARKDEWAQALSQRRPAPSTPRKRRHPR